MILWVFIEFFGVKIVITDILPIYIDIYQYFTDIFSEIPAHAYVLHSRDFLVEKSVFSNFTPIFFYFRLSFAKIFSMPAENQFFCDISAEKSEFFVLGYR